MERLEDFHTFCLNVEANQEVLHFSTNTSKSDGANDGQQSEEYIDVAEYNLKTDVGYIVTLTQTDIDDDIGGGDSDVEAEVDVDTNIIVDTESSPADVEVRSSLVDGRTDVKEEYLDMAAEAADANDDDNNIEEDDECGGGDDEDDCGDSDSSDFIDDLPFNDDNLFESHEKFAGFPRIIVKNSKLIVRGTPLLELIEKFYQLECDLCPNNVK